MKIEFLAFSALAASAAAVPIRIITLSGPVPHLSPSEVSHSIHPVHIGGHPHPHPPCHGKGKAGGFADLLMRLGFGRPHGHGHDGEHRHHHSNSAVSHHAHAGHHKHEDHDHDKEWQVIKAWKNHVEEIGNRIVPVVEGGAVRILPFIDEDGVRMEEAGEHGRHGYKHAGALVHAHEGGHLRDYGGHRWHRASFAGRLEAALSALNPTEATALAFVIGAGIGSILHLFFMLFLITIRRMRGLKCRSKEERKEARRARKEAKKARVEEIARSVVARLGGGEGGAIQLGEGEELPGYGEGEGDTLVQKT